MAIESYKLWVLCALYANFIVILYNIDIIEEHLQSRD